MSTSCGFALIEVTTHREPKPAARLVHTFVVGMLASQVRTTGTVVPKRRSSVARSSMTEPLPVTERLTPKRGVVAFQVGAVVQAAAADEPGAVDEPTDRTGATVAVTRAAASRPRRLCMWGIPGSRGRPDTRTHCGENPRNLRNRGAHQHIGVSTCGIESVSFIFTFEYTRRFLANRTPSV